MQLRENISEDCSAVCRVDNNDNTLDEALNTFVSYYEQNEMF